MTQATRLLKIYRDKILPDLQQELAMKNPLAAPRLQKVVINAGVGRYLQQNPKAQDAIIQDLARIAGQRPVTTRARKAISAFKIRAGQAVGAAVTLRGKRMYDFLEKLTQATLPRLRDFRGLSRKGFDGKGNYTLGIKEHTVFPEMAEREIGSAFGVEVTIVTTAEDDESAYLLLKKMGFPFND